MKKVFCFIITFQVFLIFLLLAPAPVVAASINCEDILKSDQVIQVVLSEPLTDKPPPDSEDHVKICYQGVVYNDVTKSNETQYYTDFSACQSGSEAALMSAGAKTDSVQSQAILACPRVEIIYGDKPLDVISYYIQQLYLWGASIIGIVAVGVIAFSGIQIAASRGENIDTAKARIMQALSAIVLLFLSSLILYTINPGFFTAT